MRQAARAGVFAASPEISTLGRVPSIEIKYGGVCFAKLIRAACDNGVHSRYDTFKFQYRERTCAGSGAKSKDFRPQAISAHSVRGVCKIRRTSTPEVVNVKSYCRRLSFDELLSLSYGLMQLHATRYSQGMTLSSFNIP